MNGGVTVVTGDKYVTLEKATGFSLIDEKNLLKVEIENQRYMFFNWDKVEYVGYTEDIFGEDDD